jgi:predicted MFS family arabinose efflux permease
VTRWLPVAVLALGTFASGTDSFLIAGILPEIGAESASFAVPWMSIHAARLGLELTVIVRPRRHNADYDHRPADATAER